MKLLLYISLISILAIELCSCQTTVKNDSKEFIEFKLDGKPCKIIIGPTSYISADFYDEPDVQKQYEFNTSFNKSAFGSVNLNIYSHTPIQKTTYNYTINSEDSLTPTVLLSLPTTSPRKHDGFIYLSMRGRSTGAVELTSFSDEVGGIVKGKFHFENLGYYHLDSINAASWGHKITEGHFSIIIRNHYIKAK